MKFYMYEAEDPFFVFGYGNRQDTLLRIRVDTTRNLGVHFSKQGKHREFV